MVKFLIRFTYKYADKIISISRDLGFDHEKICHKKFIVYIIHPLIQNYINIKKERKIRKK